MFQCSIGLVRLCLLMMLLSISCRDLKQNETKNLEDRPESTPKTEVKKKRPKANSIVIYDRQSDGSMAYREVSLASKQIDAVRDATQDFIDQSQFKGDYRNLRLQRIGMINRKANFAFAGEVKFSEESEFTLFRQALDSTLVYHFKANNFTVHLNGKKW